MGIPQRSGGPGLLGTALAAGAAGVGGAALYNAFNRHDDPKTTVIILNNTQPAAAAPAGETTVTQLPMTSQVPQQYPNQPYQGPYPNQPYPGQYPNQPYPGQYPNQPYQGYNPNDPYNQYNQQYPGQQPYPQQPYPQQPPVPGTLPVVSTPVEGAQPLVNESSTAIPAPVSVNQEVTTGATISGETTTGVAGEATTIPPSVEVSTSAGLTNTSVPINANSNVAGEIVEQKSVTTTNQENPKASESKAENSGISLQNSMSVLSLSVLYHIFVKYLL